jgi:phosphoribosylformylglycinamidine synthase
MMAAAAAAGVLCSAHDPSEGGLAVALAECCFRSDEVGRGGRFELPAGLRDDVILFSESPSRMVVTTRDEVSLQETARRHDVPFARLGTVGGGHLTLVSGGRVLVDLPVARLREAWMSLDGALGA